MLSFVVESRRMRQGGRVVPRSRMIMNYVMRIRTSLLAPRRRLIHTQDEEDDLSMARRRTMTGHVEDATRRTRTR